MAVDFVPVVLVLAMSALPIAILIYLILIINRLPGYLKRQEQRTQQIVDHLAHMAGAPTHAAPPPKKPKAPQPRELTPEQRDLRDRMMGEQKTR